MRAMGEAFLPTADANREGNLKNGGGYISSNLRPLGPQSPSIVGLVQHRIDRGFARSIQAVS